MSSSKRIAAPLAALLWFLLCVRFYDVARPLRRVCVAHAERDIEALAQPDLVLDEHAGQVVVGVAGDHAAVAPA